MINSDFYKPGDEKMINELYNRVFARNRSINQWKWEFLDIPRGKTFIRVLKDGQNLVGHFSLLPFQMCNKDEVVLTGKTENIMLHHKYRGRGLYTEFAKESLGLAKKEGFKVAWVTLTPAIKTMKRAGYVEVLTLYSYLCPLSASMFGEYFSNRFGLNNSLLAKCAYEVFKCFTRSKARLNIQEVALSEYISFFDEWRSHQQSFSVLRSYDFLEWRFLNNPYNFSYSFVRLKYKNQPVAYAIFVKKRNSLCIEDLLFINEFEELLKKSVLDSQNNWSTARYTNVQNANFLGHFKRKRSGQMLVNNLDCQEKWLSPPNWYFTRLFMEGIA